MEITETNVEELLKGNRTMARMNIFISADNIVVKKSDGKEIFVCECGENLEPKEGHVRETDEGVVAKNTCDGCGRKTSFSVKEKSIGAYEGHERFEGEF